MAELLGGLRLAVSVSFVLLSIATLTSWLRLRERTRAHLAVAIGLLGAAALISRLNRLTGGQFDSLLTVLVLASFMASAYALLLFRGTFLPLPRLARRLALFACVGCVALAGIVQLQTVRRAHSTPQSVVILAIVLVWCACVGEPILRFWLASRRRPAVQRARLRALAGGYLAIIVILVISALRGSAAAPAVEVMLQLVALTAVPLLYASFAPPAWLRRAWREPEEEEFRSAIQDLLLFSPDRTTLASRGLEWAIRLVGADSAAVLEAGGEVLAARGLDPERARFLAEKLDPMSGMTLTPLEGRLHQDAILVSLPLDSGPGALVVVAGPFTPVFGSDELARLRQYSTSMTIALDRARVVERMAAVEKMKTQFLNLASHELRSPLSVIGGYVTMLEQGALGEIEESGRRALRVLKAKTMEMNLLVEQMLDAARLEDGSLALKLDRADLRQLVTDSVEAVRPLAGDHHSLVVEALHGEVPVMADSSKLSTILVNLLDNAIKYSPAGGEVHCRLLTQDGAAQVIVQDHGLGIATADLPKLFKRFSRIITAETQHISGTGLGLYLARELALQHGGDITVESRAGMGSTFTLSLPLIAGALNPQPGPRLRVIKPDEEAAG